MTEAGDLFATKGLEYVLVIGYLLLLVLCWRFVRPRKRAEARRAAEVDRLGFDVPDDCYLHPGHAWASQHDGTVMRAGIDGFARRLLGPFSRVELPKVGARLTAGEPGWHVVVDGRRIPVLSPVDGDVVRCNGAAAQSPERVRTDPYGEGWLVEVRVPNPEATKRNLLSGRLARAWRDEVVDQLREATGIDAGAELPVDNGLARTLDPDGWEKLIRSFFLIDTTVSQARVEWMAGADAAEA